MRRILLPLLLCYCCSAGVWGYSKVATNNGQARAAGTSSQEIAFTVSPVYVATPRSVELRPGEVVNHPSTAKYSTLDEELVAKLDSLTSGRNRVVSAQDRFHPPASFEHVLSHSNALRQQQKQPQQSPSNNDVVYAKPLVSMTYDDYPPSSFDSKPSGKPISAGDDSFPAYSPSKFPDSFSSPVSDGNDGLSSYNGKPPDDFEFDQPPKSFVFSGHYDQPFDDSPPYHHHHEEVIYDHIPDDHDFHHHHHHHHRPHPMTTEEPEMMDQRLNKRPYSYYYIGKKLWYVPLYFSIYFIIYIAALVLKSVARHKINFPAHLAAVAANEGARSDNDAPAWRDYVTTALEAVEKYGNLLV